MGKFRLQYTGTEAIEIIKSYYPNDWKNRIEVKKQALLRLSFLHKVSIEKAYRKFVMPLAGNQESIVFFAALSELIKFDKMQPKEKAAKILELEEKRENVRLQIIALENNTNSISYEDKKMLRGHYTKLQQDTTAEINQLINSFDVVEPQLIIYQPGLFDPQINS
jgi:hypothetical protein